MTIVPSDSSETRVQRDVVRPEPRVVMIGPATVFVVLGIAVLVGLGLILIYLAWQVLTWIFVAAVLACALNPAVDAIERKGLRRGYAAAIVFILARDVLGGNAETYGFLMAATGVGSLVSALSIAFGQRPTMLRLLAGAATIDIPEACRTIETASTRYGVSTVTNPITAMPTPSRTNP